MQLIHKYVIFIISLACVGALFFVTQNRPLSEEEIISERKVRESAILNDQNVFPKTREHKPQSYYYEEQRPVMVHAENYLNNAEFKNDDINYYEDQNYEDKDRNYNFDYEQMIGAPEQRDMSTELEGRPSSLPAPVTPTKSTFDVLLSVAKDFKTMYDIYKAFSSALSTTPVHNETTGAYSNEAESERERRQSTELAKKETGRYIKGDPLKGYYDFVITEGSYKFWAVFQVGTAILIIYSTFAAIYYSKVNPLTSDYDYADYLGAARSFNGENLDFVDPLEDNNMQTNSENNQNTWYTNLLPKIGKSLKTVLETIDKLNENEDKPKLYDKLLATTQQVVYS